MIQLRTSIHAPIDKVWDYWTQPDHIIQWNFATDEWCCPSAINNLVPGGKFIWRMESKDGSVGFDFTWKYNTNNYGKYISYTMSDGRKVEIKFETNNNQTILTEAFEAEGSNTDDQQRAGWQAILANFKKYVEES